MIQTIIICLSIIVVVGLICYTCYKTHIYKANKDVLEQIYRELGWLKSDYKINSDWINKIWDNIQEIKSYLREQNERSTDRGADSTSDKLGY